MTAFPDAVALSQLPLGSGLAGLRHPAMRRQPALGYPISAVTESARPKVFYGPCSFFVYMLLTLENIYTILGTEAREIDMSFHVPANQTVSYSIYLQTLAQKFPNDFLKSREARICQAFDMGEPLWMLEPELELYFECWKQPKEKTPLELARRVVRLR